MQETERLKLTFWQYFWHYFIAFVPLVIPISNIYEIWKIQYKIGYQGYRSIEELIAVSIIPLILGIIIFIIKYKRLNFTRINLKLSEPEFKERITEIAYKEKWNILKLQKNKAELSMRAKFTRGLKMTINKKSNYLMVNSICDTGYGGFSITNENSKNIKKLTEQLKASA